MRSCDRFRLLQHSMAVAVVLMVSGSMGAQISGTGAISGVVRDSSGGLIPGAAIQATNLSTGLMRRLLSSGRGEFSIQILEPGQYRLEITKEGFATSNVQNVTVDVTQVTGLNITLTVGSQQQVVEVQATGELLQTESSTLGSVVTGQMVRNLPLVSRNYTQIVTLSPGVASDVTDAGAFGRGSTTAVAAGTTATENNFQMDGVEINDLQSSGQFSGGVAIPNPDTISEFKVQTSQYDASYGRNAGANVNVVTKTGANQFHGSLWEFFRNEALNANNYFFKKRTGSSRAAAKSAWIHLWRTDQTEQSLFLHVLPINAAGQWHRSLLFDLVEHASSHQRSLAYGSWSALRRPADIYAGTRHTGGPECSPDGSNIVPQALALFNLKLPNGQYVRVWSVGI